MSCLSLRQFSLLIILLLEPSISCPDWELIALLFGTEEVLDYQAIADVYAEKSEEMEDFCGKFG